MVSSAPQARAVYLEEGDERVFGFFHPAREPFRATGVLLCPPFGWDEVCSYRSRREWARQLAAAGHPTLRIDLPGSGDSAGAPRDPGRCAAWTGAIAAAARELTATGIERVAAIGIGLGGLLACKAIAEGAQIEEVVLWAVPSRGRALIRELRAFARLEDSGGGEELEPPPLPDGHVWAGGFLLDGDTVADIEDLDVTKLPREGLARALLLDRDGIGVDEQLRAHLLQNGIDVSVASGEGYGAMMAKPHHARSPVAVFARVGAWLEQAAPAATRAAANGVNGAQAGRRGASELTLEGLGVRETAVSLARPFGEMFGILSEPIGARASDCCAVMLNAGAIRHIGPNRLWVETSRRWAARGVATLRLDLEGIGDADGDAERFSELAQLYVPELVDQVCAALDALEARGIGRRFVLTGLCSGACWAFHAALRDQRVSAAFLLNPQALFWDPALEAARDLRRGVLRSSSWPKVLRGEVPVERIAAFAVRAPFAIPRRAVARRGARRRGEDELEGALDQLRDTDKQIRFMFSGNEPLHEEMQRDGYFERLERWPNVTLEEIPGRVHTLRPFQAQLRAHELLDHALEVELGRAGAGSSAANSAARR